MLDHFIQNQAINHGLKNDPITVDKQILNKFDVHYVTQMFYDCVTRALKLL